MRKKSFIRILVLALLIAGSFIILRSAGKSTKTPKATDCKDIKQACTKCVKQPISPQPDGMIWENLSRQFSS